MLSILILPNLALLVLIVPNFREVQDAGTGAGVDYSNRQTDPRPDTPERCSNEEPPRNRQRLDVQETGRARNINMERSSSHNGDLGFYISKFS